MSNQIPARGSSSTTTIPSAAKAILRSLPRRSPSIPPKHRRKSSHHRSHHSRRSRRPHHTSALNDKDSIFYLNYSDHPRALIVSDKLVGESNYTTWTNAIMKLSLISRRKISFINGKVKKPESVDDRDYKAWETVNGLVLSWIVNGASLQIASTLMHSEQTCKRDISKKMPLNTIG